MNPKTPRTQKAYRTSVWKAGLIVAAILLWLSWASTLIWLGQGQRLPLDWEGLWDAGARPHLRPSLLGIQNLHWGGSMENEDGNPAFRLGGERAVHLGKWAPRSIGPGASFGAWIKLEGNLPQSNLVALAGTAPPNEWGFGALDGRPSAWFTEMKGEGRAAFRLVAKQTWPTGRWVHLMVVAERSRCSLWMDGRRVDQKQADFIDPDSPDVWLGIVRRTDSRFNVSNYSLPEPFGFPPPEFLLDDLAIYSRDLSDREVKATVRAGRGGLLRAQQRLELRARLTYGLTPWVIIAGLFLLGLAFNRNLRFYAIHCSALFLKREFRSSWAIFLLGAIVTIGITVHLAKAAALADQERMDLFSDRLIEAAETYFERVADVLRRARDVARLNPEISLADWSKWAGENGFPSDFPYLDGIGWARRVEAKNLPAVLQPIQERAGPSASPWQTVPRGSQWQLPVTAFGWGGSHQPANPTALVGWNWLTSLEQSANPGDPRAQLLERPDVSATGLIPLRPIPTEPSGIRGVQLYLPVYKSPSPRLERRDGYLVGVVFAGVRMAEMVQGYWYRKPPLFGARFITGTQNSREAVVINTGDIFPETRRPEKPYLEKEVAIRTYGRRIWVQVWTTPTFNAHSKRFWPWLSASIGGFFTLLGTGLVAVQTRGRLKEKSAAAELRAALDKLRTAQRERQVISRDIHDGAIQSLYAIRLHIERIGAGASEGSDQQHSQELASTRAGIDGVIAELRQFTAFDNPDPVLREQIGLCGVLQSYVERARASTSAELELQCVPGAGTELSDNQAVQLANIAREALSNCLRHAGPRHVRVTLEALNGGLRLKIDDDGIGFDAESPSRAGRGLENMRTRAWEAGGSFNIQSRPGEGTRVSVTLPTKRPAQNQRK